MSHSEFAKQTVDCLLAGGNDDSSDVRDQSLQGLRLMAQKDLALVLQRGAEFLLSNKPSSGQAKHRFFVCKVLTETLRSHDAGAVFVGDAALVDRLLRASIADMVSITDLTSEWSIEACALCVLMCEYAPQKGAQALLEMFGQAQIAVPHVFVIRALCDFADSKQPLRFAGSIRDVVTKMMATLAGARQDNHRMYLARALGMCAEILVRCIPQAIAAAEGADGSEPLTPRSQAASTVRPGDLGESMNTGLQMMLNEWSKSTEVRVRTQVAFATGALAAASSDDTRAASLGKMVPLVCGNIKREGGTAALEWAARGAAAFVRRPGAATLAALPPHIDTMVQCLIQSLSSVVIPIFAQTESVQIASLKRAREFLQMWAVGLFQIDPTAVLNSLSKMIDPKTGAKDTTSAQRAAVVTAITAAVRAEETSTRLAAITDHVTAVIKLALPDGDWRVRGAVCSFALAMLESRNVKRFYSAAGSTIFLSFIVKQCSISEGVASQFQAEAAKRDPGMGTSPMIIRDSARADIIRLSRGAKKADEKQEESSEGAATAAAAAAAAASSDESTASSEFVQWQDDIDRVLWPFLLEHIGSYNADPELLNFFPTFVKAASGLLERVAESDYFYIDFRANANVGRPASIAVVMLTELFLAGTVSARRDVELGVLVELLSTFAPLLDEPFIFQHLEEVPTPITTKWHETLPELLGIGDVSRSEREQAAAAAAGTNPADEDKNNWEELVCRFVGRTAQQTRADCDWAELMATAALQMLPVYFRTAAPPLQRALLILTGVLLSRSTRRDFVSGALDQLTELIDPATFVLRDGFARCLGYIAANKEHGDVVLERVVQMSKPPEKKGFFAAKSTKREHTEQARAVAGSAASWCVRRLPPAVLSSRFEPSVMPVVMLLLDNPDAIIRNETIAAIPQIRNAIQKVCASPVAGAALFCFKTRDQLLDVLIKLALQSIAPVFGTLVPKGQGVIPAANVANFIPHAQQFQSLLFAITAVVDCTVNPAVNIALLNEKVVTAVLADAFCVTMRVIDQLPEKGPVTSNSLCEAAAGLARAIVEHCYNCERKLVDLKAILPPFYAKTAAPDPRIRTLALMLIQQIVTHASSLLSATAEAATAKDGGSTTKAVDGTADGRSRIKCCVGTTIGYMVPRIVDSDEKTRAAAAETFAATVHFQSIIFVEVVTEHSVDIAGAPDAVAAVQAMRPADIVSGTGIPYQDTQMVAELDKKFSAMNKELCGVLVGLLPTTDLFLPCVTALLEKGARETPEDPSVAAIQRAKRKSPPVTDVKPLFYLSPTVYFGLSTAQTCALSAQGMLRGLAGQLKENETNALWDVLTETCRVVNDKNPTPEQVHGVTMPPSANNCVFLSLLQGVRNLAKHHMLQLFRRLLACTPAPHASHMVHITQSIGSDGALATALVRHSLDTLLNHAVTEDRANEKKPYLAIAPLQAAACLQSLVGCQKGCEAVTAHRCPSFGALSIYLNNMYDCPAADAQRGITIVAGCIRSVVECTGSSDTLRDRMERYGWGRLSQPGKAALACHALGEITKYIAEDETYGLDKIAAESAHADLTREFRERDGLQLPLSEPTQFVVDLSTFLMPFANKTSPAQRRMSIVVSGYLLRHAKEEETLVQTLINALLSRSGPDEVPDLRMEAMRAFEVILLYPYAAVANFVPTIFAALLSCLDDNSRLDVCLTAIKVLRHMSINISDKTALIPIFVTIVLRLRTKFESPEVQLRIASISFFADLVVLAKKGFVDPTACEGQIDQHFVTIFLRVEDPDPEVRVRASLFVARAMVFLAGRQKSDALRNAVAETFGEYVCFHTVESIEEKKAALAASAAANNGAAQLPERKAPVAVDMEGLWIKPWSKIWVTFFLGKVKDSLQFFIRAAGNSGMDQRIRTTAASVIAALVKQLPKSELQRVSFEHAMPQLVTLCKDKLAPVRQKCLQAMSHLPYQ